MTTSRASPNDGNHPETFEIRVQGLLDARWSDRLAGMQVDHQPDGTTTLTGPLPDQAALHGVLTVLRDLGVPIVSVCSRT